MISVGMDMIPSLLGTSGLASMSILRTLMRSPSSLASDSTTGAIIRQGAHHSAQKSTSTTWSASRTSDWNSASVTAGTALDIGWSLLAGAAAGGLALRRAAPLRLARLGAARRLRAGALALGRAVALGGAVALGRRRRAGAAATVLVVGGVEAAALELDAHRIEQLPQRAAALGAHAQRLGRHALEHLELVATLAAPVSVDRHLSPRSRDFSRGRACGRPCPTAIWDGSMWSSAAS